MQLTNNELKEIKAGTAISGTLINALVRGINIFIDAGRYLGSSIRRFAGNKSCGMK